jgi:hypothetical protein
VRRWLLILMTGCGRISFDILGDDVPGDASNDGSAGDALVDAPPDAITVRACHSDGRYETFPGLTNTYREGAALVSWSQARLDCMADDADLWVVESALEQNAFTGDWTGITDDVVENEWRKLDGTLATFLPFQVGEPDGGNSDNCIRTDNAGFEDRSCNDLRDYVCECPAP